MGVAYEISRDVFKTVFCSGRKHGCGLPAAARQAQPGGGSTERFYLFIFLVVTLLYNHSLSVPLELGPHSNKLHLEHHGPPGKMRKRGRHTPVGRKRRE